MMLITQGQGNIVIFTLTEKCTISNPFFLFALTNDQSQETSYFVAADISSWPDRYNKFIITEKSAPNTLNGEVSLKIAGDYHYSIYEQESPNNLNPTNTISVVEIGKCKVSGSTTSNTTYTSSPTNIVYNG